MYLLSLSLFFFFSFYISYLISRSVVTLLFCSVFFFLLCFALSLSSAFVLDLSLLSFLYIPLRCCSSIPHVYYCNSITKNSYQFTLR